MNWVLVESVFNTFEIDVELRATQLKWSKKKNGSIFGILCNRCFDDQQMQTMTDEIHNWKRKKKRFLNKVVLWNNLIIIIENCKEKCANCFAFSPLFEWKQRREVRNESIRRQRKTSFSSLRNKIITFSCFVFCKCVNWCLNRNESFFNLARFTP